MIPLVQEPKELYEEFGIYEKCFFKCGEKTDMWHAETNQPVCKSCAKLKRVSELPKSSDLYKPVTKKGYAKG